MGLSNGEIVCSESSFISVAAYYDGTALYQTFIMNIGCMRQ